MFTREANKILFLLMKYVFEFNYLKEHLQEILELGKNYFQGEEGTGFLKSILIYLYSTNDMETGTVVSVLDKISKKGGELAMTTAMRLRREAKSEVAKKMLEKGYSIEEICDITGLDREEVEALREEGGK